MIYKELAQFLLHKTCCNYNVNAAALCHFLPKNFSKRDFKQNLKILPNILYLQIKKVFAKENLELRWSNGRE